MNAEQFVSEVAIQAFENVFNPYHDRCLEFDTRAAPELRRAALLKVLSLATEVDLHAIWIGRDLGYRGGRRTGLALTDDIHLAAHGNRWSVSLSRPTVGAPIAERTAAVIWSALSAIEEHVFLWNVFPYHPHEPQDPFSNRPHNRRERQAGEAILFELVNLLKPRFLLAIGNDAASSATRIAGATKVLCARHPSYGGQTTFTRQVREIYAVR